jgi:hypothetical protein
MAELAGTVEWDSQVDEPFIRVGDTIRLTPVRISDADAWVSLNHPLFDIQSADLVQYELYNSPDVVRNAYLRRKPSVRHHPITLGTLIWLHQTGIQEI